MDFLKIVVENSTKSWPILSAISTPGYKFLIPILSALTVNDYIVKYSFSLAKTVSNFDHIFLLQV